MKRTSIGRRALVAAGVGAVLALAACSSSSTSSAPAATSSAPAVSGSSSSAPAPVTSTGGSASASGPIVVGGITDGNDKGLAQGFQARIDRFNKAGGIDGRQVKLAGVLDDGSNPSANLSDAQTLVLKDNVFAVTPYESQVFSPASAALINQHDLPYIGWAINPSACAGDGAFPINGCASSGSYASTHGWKLVASALKMPAGQVKMAFIGIDNAGGAAGTKQLAFSAKAAGTQVVYAQSTVPQSGTTDYSPYTQAILASNPNVVFLVLDFATAAAITGALRQAGYTGAVINPTAYVPGLLTTQKQLTEALQGSLVSLNFPAAEAGSAVTKQALADVKAAGDGNVLSLGLEVGWFSADEFIQELQATAKAGPLTSANFVKTIHAGFTYTDGAGGLEGITFPANQTKPTTCSGYMLVKPNGTYSVASPFSCDPSALVTVS